MPSPTPTPTATRDITVGELFNFVKALPQDALVVETEIKNFLQPITGAVTDPVLAKKIDAVLSLLQKGEQIVNADVQLASNTVSKLPLVGLVSGVKIPESGAVLNALSVIPQGLESAMTHNQKTLHLVAGITSTVFLVAGGLLSTIPAVGALGIGGGLTLAVAISALKNILTPFLSAYSDSPLTK